MEPEPGEPEWLRASDRDHRSWQPAQ